jgi:hypothetical protein
LVLTELGDDADVRVVAAVASVMAAIELLVSTEGRLEDRLSRR